MLHEISAFYKISQKSHQPLFATKRTTKYRAMPLEERRPETKRRLKRGENAERVVSFFRGTSPRTSCLPSPPRTSSLPPPASMHRSKTRRSLFSSFFFFFSFVSRLLDSPRPLGRFQKLSSYFNGNLAEKCTIDELNVKSGWIRRGRVNARYHASLGQLYAKA